MKEYVISVKIVEVNKEKALEELDRIVKIIRTDIIELGGSDMSEHDDSYLPYYFWDCFERDHIL
jgi:hypothetical protein